MLHATKGRRYCNSWQGGANVHSETNAWWDIHLDCLLTQVEQEIDSSTFAKGKTTLGCGQGAVREERPGNKNRVVKADHAYS